MAVSAAFIGSLIETLSSLGHVTHRRMFGGAALYCDGVTFALVNDDVLYLKVDETSRDQFIAEGYGPFEYSSRGSVQVLASYHRAPDRLLDDADELRAWCARASTAARQAAAAKASKSRIGKAALPRAPRKSKPPSKRRPR